MKVLFFVKRAKGISNKSDQSISFTRVLPIGNLMIRKQAIFFNWCRSITVCAGDSQALLKIWDYLNSSSYMILYFTFIHF